MYHVDTQITKSNTLVMIFFVVLNFYGFSFLHAFGGLVYKLPVKPFKPLILELDILITHGKIYCVQNLLEASADEESAVHTQSVIDSLKFRLTYLTSLTEK